MGSPAVVERQIQAQAFARLRHTVVGAQVDLFVFDRPPEPFDKNVVPGIAKLLTGFAKGMWTP